MLASPHYGERWARHWLDLARYADSNGFQRDGFRTVWPYRDWVVDAFNRDMPFDRFTLEQVAGDLLPGAGLSQKIATGFNRCTTVNVEAGTQREENRVNGVFDRVNTTATVWLGLTVGCAQCHNHKFDPIAQKEYYRLFAFFNNCEEPELRLGTPEDEARGRKIDQLEAELQPFALGLRRGCKLLLFQLREHEAINRTPRPRVLLHRRQRAANGGDVGPVRGGFLRRPDGPLVNP